jgi:hypothetical protein
MPVTNLKNIIIQERTTINGETYFIIKDNEQNQVYFCFQNKLKDSWQELVNNKENIREVEIEYREQGSYKQVISFYASQEGDILI